MSDEAIISSWIAHHMGARVVDINRQARWRSAWLVEAERDGEPLSLVVRGERGAGIPMQFPLRHEMSLQRVMAASAPSCGSTTTSCGNSAMP